MGRWRTVKKKNVKFRTGLNLKAVTWKGAESGVTGGRGGWLKESMMSLGRKGGRLLTGGGRWGGSKLFSKMTVGKFEEEEFSEDSDEWEIVDFDSSEGEESGAEEDDIEEDPALSLKRKITNERLRRAGHVNKNILEEASKIEEENNIDKNDDMSFIEGDIQTFDKITNTTTTLKTFTEEPEEHDMDEDGDENDIDEVRDLNIPGSFPTAFEWTPSLSIVDMTESVRRVTSVVLRRPKRNGPFGGSGGFWVMKTRKIKKRSITGMDVSSAVLKKSSSKLSPITKKKSSKSLALPKRIRIRRNSI